MSFVSILIPCYQERAFIGPCVESILAFELPAGMTIEVLVLDGMSTDGTRDVVAELAIRNPCVRLVDNPARFQSQALNTGISESRGTFIARMDAHAVYSTDYLRRCVETAIRTGASNVGGCVTTEARGRGFQSMLVQALTTHSFGVGDSGFRTGTLEGEADTVPFGFFRRDIFDTIGLFDERLLRGQDFEINRRIACTGGRIWLNPLIQARYFQQPTLATFYWKQFARQGPYNAYMWYLARYAFVPRHAITAVFAIGVLGGVLLSGSIGPLRLLFVGVMTLYAVLAIVSSAQQAVRYRQPFHVLTLPICFFLFHFVHGIGVLSGLLRLSLGIAPVQKVREPWPGARRYRAWPPTVTRRAERNSREV